MHHMNDKEDTIDDDKQKIPWLGFHTWTEKRKRRNGVNERSGTGGRTEEGDEKGARPEMEGGRILKIH